MVKSTLNPTVAAAAADAAAAGPSAPYSFMFEHACAAAGNGLRVFPITAGRKAPPLLQAWPTLASTELEQIVLWAHEHPHANFGILTGTASGVFAIDPDAGVDPADGRQKEGAENLARLEADHGALPVTWEQATPGGGRHILFRHPGVPVKTKTNVLARDIDVRGDGGYIVLAPSRHPDDGAYQWTNRPDQVELAEAPAWLTRMVTEDKPKERSKPYAPPRHPVRGGSSQEQILRDMPSELYVTALTGADVGRDGKCLCPFHQERTPSFHCYPRADEGWTCFGQCTTGGSIIDFGMHLYGISPRRRGYFDILERLGADLGVPR